MAASDAFYRRQYSLDVVFGVSSVLMLVSLIWMYVQDYQREYKTEQRVFRDVESALAQRLALEQIPSQEEVAAAEAKVLEKKKEREANDADVRKLRAELGELQPKKERLEVRFQEIKSEIESRRSFYDLEVERNPGSNGQISPLAQRYLNEVAEYEQQLDKVQGERDAIVVKMTQLRAEADAYEKGLTDAISNLKKVNDRFDTQVKLAISKRWGFGDWLRNQFIIDAFAAPVKIQQVTNNNVPIDYNFMHVTRFDRCQTCHLGIDRPAYTKEKLEELLKITPEDESKLEDARAVLRSRRETLEGLPEQKQVPDPSALYLTTLPEDRLTKTRIAEYAAHPRLDLFVGANSKHPAERFGCSACHSGQGSATSFTLASHTPDNAAEKERWIKERGWESIHMWDFPMLPHRFVEASCLKCHHQVTDLIAASGRNEAPKVTRGHSLIREFGCFGCHEIAGRKGGRDVGPDMRLEPSPPLEELTPMERLKAESDPDNPPGKFRKVGPSLARLSEKTHPEWVVKWLRAPRSFRPDTKMPHFYGLSNNHPDVLPDAQKKFPDAEMWAITHYLFEASNGYVKELSAAHQADAAARAEDDARRAKLLAKTKLTDEEKSDLSVLERRQRLRGVKPLVDLAPKHKADAANGRKLFIERGCLACHSHQATEQDAKGSKSIASEANFGPNLSQVAEKLGKKAGDKDDSARIWLTQWIMDPHVHHPRSRMPVTHLEATQAADVAEWLLSQPAQDHAPDWKSLSVAEPAEKDLRELAKVYFTRLLPRSDMERFIDKGEKLEASMIKDLPKDEQELANNYNPASLKRYLGKKAVGRLGCYACHEIPGFDAAKPIGVALNDWGKKMPDRLAYEDIVNYVQTHFNVVPSLTDKEGKPSAHVVDGKPPLEEYFVEQLDHHHRTREGFLHQKLVEPRSYDYQRVRAWDDRLRMPQFQFARIRRSAGESDRDFEARQLKEEADAREAVMTFVLGLVAEPVPTKSINQSSGDRLAQVKGRQALDNFNCAGCHLINPGVFDFKASPESTKVLAAQVRSLSGDHVFRAHSNWTGWLPAAPDKLSAYGVVVPKIPSPDDEEEEAVTKFQFKLTDALRFHAKDKSLQDVPSFSFLSIPTKDMVLPSPEVAESKERLKRNLEDLGQYGGAFADLLVHYLHKQDAKEYPRGPDGDSARARLLVPPILLGQGERTQSEWLYEFLLNPYQIRKMTVLRMPRFNMSKDDARAIVDYFGAVERMSNPGIGLHYPYEMIKQQDPANDEYWRRQTADYVAALKATKITSGGKALTMYDQRLQELEPVWQQTLKEVETQHSQAQSNLKAAEARLKASRAAAETLEKQLKETKDAAAQKLIDVQFNQAKDKLIADDKVKSMWENEAALLAAKLAESSVAKQKEAWSEREAYITDAFRLTYNRQLCLQCHSLGAFEAKNDILGPSLTNTHKRLRPGWLERWLANPQRFLTYTTSMPTNFPADKEDQFGEYFAGRPLDRVRGVRDVLMIFPQAAAMPVNRHWALPPPETAADKAADKAGDKAGKKTDKTGEKK